MFDPEEELVARTERNLRQAVAEGTTETSDPEVSKDYEEFFRRTVEVLKQHGCSEKLLRAFVMFLSNFDSVDRFLREQGLVWYVGIIEDRTREIFQEEVASCTPQCPDKEDCPIPALIDALRGIKDAAWDVLTLAGEIWVLTQAMVAAFEDYAQGGQGAVGIFNGLPEDRDVQ